MSCKALCRLHHQLAMMSMCRIRQIRQPDIQHGPRHVPKIQPDHWCQQFHKYCLSFRTQHRLRLKLRNKRLNPQHKWMQWDWRHPIGMFPTAWPTTHRNACSCSMNRAASMTYKPAAVRSIPRTGMSEPFSERWTRGISVHQSTVGDRP